MALVNKPEDCAVCTFAFVFLTLELILATCCTVWPSVHLKAVKQLIEDSTDPHRHNDDWSYTNEYPSDFPHNYSFKEC